MKYRTFGRTGWRVSEVGYGMWGLAGWTGSSLESTAKALRQLRTLGWITTGRRALEVHDLQALRDRAP